MFPFLQFRGEQFEDTFLVLPTIEITAGRCPCCNQVGAWFIGFAWLCWSGGIEIGFSHD